MSVLALSGWKRSSVTEVTHPTDCLHNHAAQLSCDCLSDFLKSPAFQVTVTNPSLVTDQVSLPTSIEADRIVHRVR